MSEWLIYGKRTKPWKDKNNRTHEPDKTFRALDAQGVRVNKLDEAFSYATKEDAQERIDKAKPPIEGVIFEIRKAK